jgi:hypothetical protein
MLQVYCKDDLSNVPCWTPPFMDDKATVLNGALESLPEHMWCMKNHVKTAGCAVFQIMRNGASQLIVESNTFGNKEMLDATYYSAAACQADESKCILWKQSPPSLLDALIKMFMDIGTVPVANQVSFAYLCTVLLVCIGAKPEGKAKTLHNHMQSFFAYRCILAWELHKYASRGSLDCFL